MSIIHKNVGIIANALKRAGAYCVTVEYSGSGDSGDISNVIVSWPAENQPFATTDDLAIGPMLLHGFKSDYINGVWLQTKTMTELSITAAVESVWESAIEASGLSNFGDSDGGQGSMVINEDGTCELNHSYNDSNSESANVEFDETSRSWNNFQRVATVLRELGVENAVVHYSGYNEDIVTPTVEIGGAVTSGPNVPLLLDPLNPDGPTFELPLDEAASYLAEQAISDSGHSDYEDDDGGQGTFTITADGAVTLEHVDFYVDTKDGSWHSFNAEDDDDPDTNMASSYTDSMNP